MMVEKTLASRLRSRITLQQQVQTADGAGGFARSWSDVATIWAEILPLNGRELLQAQQLQSSVTHKITIRYRTGVIAAQRFLCESTRAFNIRAVRNVEERDELLEIFAEEGVAT